MKIKSELFGFLFDCTEALLFTLKNDKGVTIRITNYGAIVTAIEVPDKNGIAGNVVLGFNRLEHYTSKNYLQNYPYFGCVCGRSANRIAGGNLEIDGVAYQLAINNGPNHLHGGLNGFDKKLWGYEMFEEPDRVGVKLTYTSKDMEENYPGNLNVTCTYYLDNKNDFGIEYLAETDKTTVVNLTNHTYFNLTGGSDDIKNHRLTIAAEAITESVELIPTGNLLPVAGTSFDFTSPKKIGDDFLELPEGYDTNYVLNNPEGKLVLAATLEEETTGRKMECYTSQPGIQLYTGYWIPQLLVDGVARFGKFSGVALETQHYPDSVHHENFPSVQLKPGEKYFEKTIYRFL